jgi:sortase (surface protein transpeptidase)
VRSRPVPSSRRRRRFAAVLALAGIGLAVAASVSFDDGAHQRPSQLRRVLPVPAPQVFPLPTTKTSTERHSTPTKSSSKGNRQMPRPVRITIPAIGVSAPVIPLGLNPDRTMQTPQSYSVAGWFRPGPEPGEVGAAIVVGHVDSHNGPGVFYRLRALQRGDRIGITLVTGRKLRFIVTSSRDVSKQHFPTALVYRHTRRSTLRLVTCGGRFDSSTGHYVNNHIVFAWLLGAA